MIEYLKQQVALANTNEAKINKLREELQFLCLKILNDRGFFSQIAFLGGTALRVIYDMKRFSEDLDFSSVDKSSYNFDEIINAMKYEIKLNGLTVECKTKTQKTVQSSMLRFPELLKVIGVSNFNDQKLSIKFEVDSNPPKGADIVNSVVNKSYMLNITHYNLPSLFAGKLHACLFRSYTKGRDFYDLLWYLGKGVMPNIKLLNNAIKQTQGKDLLITKDSIKELLVGKLANTDFNDARKDVERFLEDKAELKLLDKEILLNAVKQHFN